MGGRWDRERGRGGLFTCQRNPTLSVMVLGSRCRHSPVPLTPSLGPLTLPTLAFGGSFVRSQARPPPT